METTSSRNGARSIVSTRSPTGDLEFLAPVNESTARLLGIAAVLGIAVIHILDAAGTYHSTRWIFWAYIALIAAAVPIALVLLQSASPLVWGAAAAFGAVPLVGYLWSRSIGLPGDAADVGNWLCTLGMVALFVETALIALSATRLFVCRRWR